MTKKILNGEIFGYVECDISVPKEISHKFDDFPPIFKNTNVSTNDIGEFMQSYALENGYMKQPRRMLISSHKLEKGLLITPLLQYYIKLGLKLQKIYQVVEYEGGYPFKEFVNNMVEARRKGDENPQSGVVAETMKLISNSSYGYQIMDRCRHSETRYVKEDTACKLINKKQFKDYTQIDEDLFEITSAKSKTIHKEPIVVGFFILQFAKLRMLELYYNFLDKFCDKSKFEEIEMDTDSLYMAISVDTINDLVFTMRNNCTHLTDTQLQWLEMRSRDCRDDFEADPECNFFPRTCCDKNIDLHNG
jgi:hypothetical protein